MRLNPKPFELGRVFGIPIRAHYSWLPVFPFYAWAIASFYLPREVQNLRLPELPVYQYWLLGVLTTALLFASVLAHELSHALMARAEGLGTGNITLYIFGGLAALEGQPANPAAEFKIAVVGPAASFILGTLFLAIDQLVLFNTSYRTTGQVFQHLGLVNWFLAGFNILPGLPLDGGRVLRAVLWHFNKNFRVATQIALRAGLIIAVTLVVWGVYTLLFKDFITGIWCVTIGLVIALMLATAEGRSRGVWRVQRGTVEDVMNRDVVLISPDMKVADFINKVLKNNRHTSFPVASEKRLHGLLLLEELKSVAREDWPRLTARDCMRPVDESMFLSVLTPVAEARARVESNGLGRAVVLDSRGLIVGYVSLHDIANKS
ncbi:MAG TPA: site-2 protease family protein [Blastocatellia bacterium]|nr:site-2 protease family protein [Blastocatellia bacterium]